ncbi:MAG: hypothetical protein JSV88_25835 [Candidatus Aminicenantes bacterium]|nr:MAG: hypothetical protein JSV88_25835 [Candidatus Aminicenantes bacterium]
MVIKLFEPEVIYRPTILFRGRDSYFWKRKIFKDLEPYDDGPHHHSRPPGTPGKGFHFLIIFDPSLFLVVDTEGIGEIIGSLSRLDPAREFIFSIEGTPFFVVSYGAFQKLKLNLKEDQELIAKLRNHGNLRMIQLPERVVFDVLDVRKDLKAIENAVISCQLAALTANGVIIEDLGHFFIEGMIPIGAETRISTGVVIKGDSKIGTGVHLYPHSYIENSIIGDGCTLLPGCIVRDSFLEENVQIGPYTHLRNGAVVKKGAKMGNFVEMKKSVLGEGSKSMHLTYIGDAEVGENVNIGAGTITCNYDGVRKHRTIIEDGVFIGSGSQLVAPVVVRKNSYVGAGSTITEEVPEDTLALARQRQTNIPDWAARKKTKKNPKPDPKT